MVARTAVSTEDKRSTRRVYSWSVVSTLQFDGLRDKLVLVPHDLLIEACYAELIQFTYAALFFKGTRIVQTFLFAVAWHTIMRWRPAISFITLSSSLVRYYDERCSAVFDFNDLKIGAVAAKVLITNTNRPSQTLIKWSFDMKINIYFILLTSVIECYSESWFSPCFSRRLWWNQY